MTWFTKLVGWLIDPSPPIDRRMPRVELNEGGFDLVAHDGAARSIRWDSISRVATYKYDNFATDEIVLSFETTTCERRIEVSEDCPGFEKLFAPLKKEFAVSADWYHTVMHPAFAENHRILYERSPQPTSAE